LDAFKNLVQSGTVVNIHAGSQPQTSQSISTLYETPLAVPSSTIQPFEPASQTSDSTTIQPVSEPMGIAEETLPRTLNGAFISATAINDCFDTFKLKYSRQLPVVEGHIRPNKCFAQSPLLFWTIVIIGSRKYTRDPTLLSLLVPQVTDLIKSAAFTTCKSLSNIQAFLLLCTWPLPFDSLSKDITTTLSGVLLQHALSLGLYVYGVGQDFSRIKLRKDRTQTDMRARLWAMCIVVCQRYTKLAAIGSG
jgi:transcriptional regulatory protein LEU3